MQQFMCQVDITGAAVILRGWYYMPNAPSDQSVPSMIRPQAAGTAVIIPYILIDALI